MVFENIASGPARSMAAIRRRHLGASSLVIAAMLLPMPALAQVAVADAAGQTGAGGGAAQGPDAQASDQDSALSTDTKGDIVVTGIRASLQTAQARKQNAEQIVDLDHGAGYWRLAGSLRFGSAAAHRRYHAPAHQREPRSRPPVVRRRWRVHPRPFLGALRTQRPRRLLGEQWPRAELRGCLVRSARRRRRVQEPVGRTGRGRYRRHRQSAHAQAVRFHRPRSRGVGRLQLCRSAQKGFLVGQRPRERPLVHPARRDRRAAVVQHRQYRQPHRQYLGRPVRFGAIGQGTGRRGRRHERLCPERHGFPPDRLGAEAHGLCRIGAVEAERHAVADRRSADQPGGSA